MDDPRRSNFYAVVSDAIADMLEHGFDTMDRVDGWQARIRKAAEASLLSEAKLTEMLTDGLSDVYEKLVGKGKIAERHPGVSRFTIEKMKPELRKLLDQRIMASANLIKLNRRQSIDKTLSRFSGWATSIPKGGTTQAKKSEVRTSIRKSLVSLPFEERRVLVDQGHKLSASISEVVAIGGHAIAARWRSHWRQPGYDYRDAHKERDQQVYLLRESWAVDAGLVKKGNNPYYDQITKAGEEPFCRCFIVWIYALRDLPDDMLTIKGKKELERVRAELAQ
jgi:hypothetical protein